MLDTEREKTMSEQSFNTSQTVSAFYDPESSCWRTSQESLLSEVPSLLERLPDWGTTAAGALCVQATPGHLTAVRDGSASLATPTAWLGRRLAHAKGDAERWHNPERSNELSDQMAALLPTPRVSMKNGPSERELAEGNPKARLETAAALLPTPTSQAAKHGATPDIHANGYGSNLWDLPHLLPTPTVNDMGRGKTVEEWDSWTDEMKERHDNGNGHGASLEIEAARLLPTPTVNDSHNHNPTPGDSQFNRNDLALPALMRLLPTPAARDWKDTGENTDYEKVAAKSKLGGLPALLPTPTSVDSKVFGPNVNWQLRLTDHAPHTASVLMNLRSSDGNTSSDDQPQPPPTTEDSDPSSSNG